MELGHALGNAFKEEPEGCDLIEVFAEAGIAHELDHGATRGLGLARHGGGEPQLGLRPAVRGRQHDPGGGDNGRPRARWRERSVLHVPEHERRSHWLHTQGI